MAVDFGKAKGSQLLKDVASKNSVLNNGTLVVHLEIDKLHDNPDNKYLFGMDEEDIRHTAEGIKRNGFHGAIEVFDTKEGIYEIYSGHIRKYGAMEAGMDKIPCIISPMPEPAQKRRLLVGANLYGRNKIKGSNPIYTGRQLVYHKETLKMEGFKGDIREQLAKEFGISGSQVLRYMALTEMIEQLQEITGTGLVPFTMIYRAKSYPEEKQKELYEYIMEKAGSDLEPLTKSELKECFFKMHGEQPVPGQMEISNYNVDTEMISVISDGDEAADKLTEQKSCDGNCFYCQETECNSSQEKREYCIFDSEQPCNMYNIHEKAISLGVNCNSSCCRDCDKECSVRCNHWKHVETYPVNNTKAQAIENVVHGEQLKIPSANEVYKVYEDIERYVKGIKNYYKLRDYLINNYGKSHSYRGRSDINFQCSIRGIRINRNDEITWSMFLDILSEMIPLDKTKQEEQSVAPVPAVRANENEVTRAERMIYEVERQLSNDTTDSIPWSRPEDALKVLRSLVAMLEDEIEAIS
ncbi:MAG: ParB N-terminal domain-containing protein [Bacteroides sp.]|nr:ParB N-terminal domain-containing protein [Bacteroides sp.]MCM1550539.1 ParB N-terminal domain-containing protein [Clostridium sp.]